MTTLDHRGLGPACERRSTAELLSPSPRSPPETSQAPSCRSSNRMWMKSQCSVRAGSDCDHNDLRSDRVPAPPGDLPGVAFPDCSKDARPNYLVHSFREQITNPFPAVSASGRKGDPPIVHINIPTVRRRTARTNSNRSANLQSLLGEDAVDYDFSRTSSGYCNKLLDNNSQHAWDFQVRSVHVPGPRRRRTAHRLPDTAAGFPCRCAGSHRSECTLASPGTTALRWWRGAQQQDATMSLASSGEGLRSAGPSARAS